MTTCFPPNQSQANLLLYLRTFNAVGNHSEALKEFQRRVDLGGWREEVYESLFAMAYQKKALGYSWAEVQQQFLDAHIQRYC